MAALIKNPWVVGFCNEENLPETGSKNILWKKIPVPGFGKKRTY
jgi:hypothetical protein